MTEEPQKVTERGNLLEINWANLSAELHTPLGVVRLEFAEDFAEMMQVAARQYVAITGVRRVTADGYVRATAVESVEILERPATPFGIVNEVNLVRSPNFNPLEFEHPDMPHDDVLDAWVENILSGKYKG